MFTPDSLTSLATFLQDHAKELASFVVPLVTWLINYLLRSKVKLVYSIPHGFTFKYDEKVKNDAGDEIAQSSNIETRSVIVFNRGNEIAKKVEIVINYTPQLLNIWPVRNHQRINLDDGRLVIIFDSLAKDEGIALEMLSMRSNLPAITLVRCEQGAARLTKMIPQPILPNWKVNTYRALNVLGLGAGIYIGLSVLQFFISRNP